MSSTPSRRSFVLGGLALLLSGTSAAGSDYNGQGTQGDRRKGRKKRRNKRRFRTVTRTFRNGAVIALGPETTADPYPSAIRVSGFKRGRVRDVNVTLRDFSHTFPPDVDLLLMAPNGRRAILVSDAGSVSGGVPAVSNLTLTLDDQAANRLPSSSLLRSGRFRPANHDIGDPEVFPAPGAATSNVALANFRGIDPNGTWRLFVVDDFTGSAVGSIADGWSLRIKARVRK